MQGVKYQTLFTKTYLHENTVCNINLKLTFVQLDPGISPIMQHLRPMLKFSKVDQTLRSGSQGQNFWY